MLVLVEPLFTIVDDDYPTYLFISDNSAQEQSIISTRIIDILTSEDFFPQRKVYRLGETNYFVIETLPTDPIDNIKDIYFNNLQDSVDTTLTIDNVNVSTNITFMTHEYEDNTHESDSFLAEEESEYKDNGPQFNELNLDNVFLNFTNYSGANFFESSLLNGQFLKTKLYHANFNDAELRGANFKNADLRFASLIYADLSPLLIPGQPSIKTDLSRANLRHADLSGVNFTGADLSGADLRQSILDNQTNFTDCILVGTKLGVTNWQNTIFGDAIQYADLSEEFLEAAAAGAAAEAAAAEEAQAEAEDDDTINDDAVEGDKNICLDYIQFEDKNILKYLKKNPFNIIIKKINGEFECESLTSLRQQYKNEPSGKYKYYGYYECSEQLMENVKKNGYTPLGFGISDYDSTKEYVKIGSAQSYIEKPEWMYGGPPPEPRIFELVSTGNKKYLVEKSLTKPGADVVSGVHCDLKDSFEIYKLVPIDLESMSGGKKYIKKTRRRSNNKLNKTHRHKKTIKRKKTHRHKKTIKRSNNRRKKTRIYKKTIKKRD
jgi:uncharacterized protein YjbI with pentapeptide repeats